MLNWQTEWAAFQIDEACLVAGRKAEADALKEANSQPSTFGDRRKPAKFRSLRMMASKKVKVKDGVW